MRLIWIAIFVVLSISGAVAKGDFHLFDIQNADAKVTPEVIVKAFEASGYEIAVNSEMNKPFKIQFQQTNFKIFTLLTLFHTEFSQELVKKHANAGIFVPMGVGIYQGKNEDILHVSILTAQAQAKILGFDDVILHKIEEANMAVMKKTFPKAKISISKDAIKAKGPLVTIFKMEVDEDWEEAKEELQMMVEDGFKPYGFVMPGFTDFNYIMTKEETIESPYDFYDTYSVCKLRVIYTVAKTRPEAAAFAPCTLMMYKKKGEDKIVMGFPGVYNWMSSADIKDKETSTVLMKAQIDFETILREATE